MMWFTEIISWFKINQLGIIVGAVGGTIGSTIGGFIVYFYVMRNENRKDKQNNIDNRATELLHTQMTISLQMDEVKSIEKLCQSITDFKLYDNSLEEHFKHINGISAKVTKLKQLIDMNQNKLSEDFLELTKHFVVTAPPNVIMTLPKEVFNLPKMKAKNREVMVADLAKYSKNIASCNRRYMQIISLITRQNEIRKMVVQSESPELLLEIAAANFEMAFQLKKQIEHYFKTANSAFTKTINYIQALGAHPIQVALDMDGKIIFDEISG